MLRKFVTSRKFKSPLAGFFAFLTILVLVHFVVDLQRQRLQAEEHLELMAYGNLLRTAVDRELNSLLFISNGLASYLTIYKENLQPEKVQAILENLWLRSKHVRNLGIAINTRVTYVYPFETNEKILGKDYRDLDSQWPKVEQAIQTKQGLLDGPLDLVQGGTGLVYRFPVFIDDKYWGILSTVITTDSFLKAAFKQLKNEHYSFAIRTGDSKKVFYGDADLFNAPNSTLLVSQVPNGHWEWSLKDNTLSAWQPLMILKLFGFLLSALVGLSVYYFMHERERLSEDAFFDSLTNLPNRRLLGDRMDVAVNEARRYKRLIAIMVIDVDRFKTINDNYGHDAGDQVLRVVGQNVLKSIRDSDTVGRVGGDEFHVVLKELNSINDANAIVGKIQSLHRMPFDILGHKISIHLSVGVALALPKDDITIGSLVKEADMALYEAKKMGRNTYSIRSINVS